MANDARSFIEQPWDEDLLPADNFLTERKLNTLWDWFNTATEDGVDRRLIFVKLANAVRQPYLQSASHGWPGFASYDGENTSTFTPSQSHAATTDAEFEDLKEHLHSGETTGGQSSDVRAQSRPFGKQLSIHLPPRIAIMSAYSSLVTRFIGLNGKNVTAYDAKGTGSAKIASELKEDEIFELERYPDGAVTFRSKASPNVFLRADCDARTLSPGKKTFRGSGTVNCQYISKTDVCGDNEKFRIHPLGWNGQVAIEPVALPGRYLRLHPAEKGVNLQGTRGECEKFYLIFVLD
ncbi:hypothetical protein BDZ91DRAFT_785762 [Kalaharituber pfeilii]|nr:hypothetical protein BDZ91DRAFT_785762 [Kalaharituber pfeilii]